MADKNFKKLIYFPIEMEGDIQKAAESENRSANNYVVNVVKKDIERKKENDVIK
jgi:hypothetical protein